MSSKRILLVDDDDSNLMTMTALLEDEGFDVASAQALDQARVQLRDEARFDAVVLDYHLGSDNGLDLLPNIEAHQPRPKVVVMSGFQFEQSVPGVDAVALKGEHFDRFLEMLTDLL